MLRELPVFDSVELKSHRVDRLARGFQAGEVALVRAADAVQDSDPIVLGHDGENRQS